MELHCDLGKNSQESSDATSKDQIRVLATMYIEVVGNSFCIVLAGKTHLVEYLIVTVGLFFCLHPHAALEVDRGEARAHRGEGQAPAKYDRTGQSWTPSHLHST